MSPGEMKELTLETIAKGAAVERFQDALKRVIENIMDPNTDPKAIRKIKMVVSIKPDETREQAISKLDVAVTLAAPKPVPDVMYFGQSRDSGDLVATRWDPQQLELGEKEGDRPVLPIKRTGARN